MTSRIYTAGLLLHGPAGQALDDGAVAVSGSAITDVGPRADVVSRALPGTPVAHFPGATLLPGLIDTHVHLTFDAGPDPVASLLAGDDPTLPFAVAGRARQLLDHGVTTVRDLGDRGGVVAALRDAVDRGLLAGPRVLSAGAPVTIPGGHCWFLGGEAKGLDGIREVIRRNVAAGADWIKVMATGGTLTPDGPAPAEPQFTPAELTFAVQEAHSAGKRVAAHVHGAAGVEAALDAGVDTLEHCSFIAAGGTGAGPEERLDLVDRIAATGTYVCPTYSGSLDLASRSIGPEKMRPWLDVALRQHERGVRLVAGTDAGIRGAGFDGYTTGLEWLSRAGIPTDVVLDMATSRAAEALGLGERTGRLAAGLDADLVLVEGDPRTDLSSLRSPALVVARGRAHVPPAVGERGVR